MDLKYVLETWYGLEVEVGTRRGVSGTTGDLSRAWGTWCLLRWRTWRRSRFGGRKGNVEDQEFGFGQVSFELPVKLQMEAPRRWLDIRTCCPVHSGLYVVDLT